MNPEMTGEQFALVMGDKFSPYGPWRAPPFLPKEGYSDVFGVFNLSNVVPLVEALDELALELKGKTWSRRLMRMMTWLNGQLPYKRVCQVLEEIGGIQVSTSSNWRMGQVCGTALQAEQQREAARMKAQAREWSTPGGKPQPGERMGLAMDGAMMNLREEGWKEFKVGCVFEVVLKEHQDERTGDRGMFGHAIQNS